MQPLFNSTVRGRIERAVPLPGRPDVKVPPAAPAGFAIKQAAASIRRMGGRRLEHEF